MGGVEWGGGSAEACRDTVWVKSARSGLGWGFRAGSLDLGQKREWGSGGVGEWGSGGVGEWGSGGVGRLDPGPGKTTHAMAYAADVFKLIVSQGGFFVLYVPAGYYLVLVVDLAS